ncbi:MAG: tetratricopeptide repeat protein [Pseudomonadota bacterium]
MEHPRISLAPLSAPGEVTTFYAYENGAARRTALSHTAVLLAARQRASVPVLMIDWDLEAPGLHQQFDEHDCASEHGGVLEFFEACRVRLHELGQGPAAPSGEALAGQVLDAIDWHGFITRVDPARPLYLMAAGRFDASYGERAGGFDWDALFIACPALLRCFGARMAGHFQHVLVDARAGRSALVSLCTTVLPRKLVALFTPEAGSLEGMAGVVERAIAYRASHAEEQRALLVYPVAAGVDSVDAERRQAWRAHYQGTLEALLCQCYGMGQVQLGSYLDEVQMQQLPSARVPCNGAGDRFSLVRSIDALLHWLDGSGLPWQSHTEISLLKAIGKARGHGELAPGSAVFLPLARDLHVLGQLYRGQGRDRLARPCFEESTQLRRDLLGELHGDTRASRAELAALMARSGKLAEAAFLYELLLEDCKRSLGLSHPETLAARLGLATTLGLQGQFDAALGLHAEVIDAFERQLGPSHRATLASVAAQASTLECQGELGRARMLHERVLEGRQRLLGSEHEDTLASMAQLAALLERMEEPAPARSLHDALGRVRRRSAGMPAEAAACTVQARGIAAGPHGEDWRGAREAPWPASREGRAPGARGCGEQRRLADALPEAEGGE